MYTPRLFIVFLFLSVMQGLAQTGSFDAENFEKRTLAFAERDSTLYLDFYQKKETRSFARA